MGPASPLCVPPRGVGASRVWKVLAGAVPAHVCGGGRGGEWGGRGDTPPQWQDRARRGRRAAAPHSEHPEVTAEAGGGGQEGVLGGGKGRGGEGRQDRARRGKEPQQGGLGLSPSAPRGTPPAAPPPSRARPGRDPGAASSAGAKLGTRRHPPGPTPPGPPPAVAGGHRGFPALAAATCQRAPGVIYGGGGVTSVGDGGDTHTRQAEDVPARHRCDTSRRSHGDSRGRDTEGGVTAPGTVSGPRGHWWPPAKRSGNSPPVTGTPVSPGPYSWGILCRQLGTVLGTPMSPAQGPADGHGNTGVPGVGGWGILCQWLVTVTVTPVSPGLYS